MTRAELAQELAVVTRTLVLAAAVLENLSLTLRSPQDGLDFEDDPDVAPGDDRGGTGKGNSRTRRTAASPGNLPAIPEKQRDRTGLPACTCPPCLAERARGQRP